MTELLLSTDPSNFQFRVYVNLHPSQDVLTEYFFWQLHQPTVHCHFATLSRTHMLPMILLSTAESVFLKIAALNGRKFEFPLYAIQLF